MNFDTEDQRSFRDRGDEAINAAHAESILETPGDPLTVRIPHALALLGIGRSKLYELISQQEIEIIKVGSSTLVVVVSLKAFVSRQRCLRRNKADHPLNPPSVTRAK